MDLIFDILFFLDIVVNFFSAYQDEEQHMVDNHRRIVINYLTGWFFVDLTAVLPITYFYDDTQNGAAFRYNKLLRLIRLPRLYRLVRLLKIGKAKLNVKNKT